MKKFILLGIACTLGLYAKELVVHLPIKEGGSKTLFLARASTRNADVQQSIHTLLSSDIAFNGQSNLYPYSPELQERACHSDPKYAFRSAFWQKHRIDYVLVPTLKEQEMTLQIFEVSTATLKTLYPITLTQNRAENHIQLHKLADSVHQVLHHTPGSASKLILYSHQPILEEDESTWQAEIWETDYLGSFHRQVTQENHYSLSPVFIPTQDASNMPFLYVTYKQGQPRIYRASGKESRGYPAIPLRGNQLLPALHPKGTQIAFICDAAGRADLFLQDFHPDKGVMGKPKQIFSVPGSVQASPSFHPDGSKLAFASDKGGTSRVYTLDIAQAKLDKSLPPVSCISQKFRDNTGPNWSPDGHKIAYSAKINGVRQICLYDCESDQEIQLTTGPGNKENPCWGKDNRHIVYNTTSPTFDLYLLDSQGSEPKCITSKRGKSHYATWQQ